jgi:hypothetical protein
MLKGLFMKMMFQLLNPPIIVLFLLSFQLFAKTQEQKTKKDSHTSLSNKPIPKKFPKYKLSSVFLAPLSPKWSLENREGWIIHHSTDSSKSNLIPVLYAWTPNEMTQGLSGVLPQDFSHSLGMFFWGSHRQTLSFWMPHTFFNLNIIFLDDIPEQDQTYKVVGITLNLKHDTRSLAELDRTNKTHEVASTPPIDAIHVLECKATEKWCQNFKLNDRITILRPSDGKKIKSKAHL